MSRQESLIPPRIHIMCAFPRARRLVIKKGIYENPVGETRNFRRSRSIRAVSRAQTIRRVSSITSGADRSPYFITSLHVYPQTMKLFIIRVNAQNGAARDRSRHTARADSYPRVSPGRKSRGFKSTRDRSCDEIPRSHFLIGRSRRNDTRNPLRKIRESISAGLESERRFVR